MLWLLCDVPATGSTSAVSSVATGTYSKQIFVKFNGSQSTNYLTNQPKMLAKIIGTARFAKRWHSDIYASVYSQML